MSMRIVRVQPPAGQADELARKWEASWPERLRVQPGFQHAHFGFNRATGAIAGVTVFEKKPDDALFERLSKEFQGTLGPSVPTQPPEATVYEIAAEV
jgi:hypothetical protein